MGFSFPKSLRLLTSADYRVVFKQCKKRSINGLFFVYFRKNNLPQSRLGLIVAKRELPKAVQRNRLKRLIRESFRLNQPLRTNYDVIIMVKRPCLNQSKAKLAEKLNAIWKGLN